MKHINNYPLISIIVPVYNVELYLPKCIDSILAQTYTNYEVLLINDGSPDNCGAICDSYAEQDNRIRVFHKKNGGVSSARQLGIEQAKGVYSIHVDSDDWIEPNMLQEMYKLAIDSNSDIVISDFFVNKGEKQIYRTQIVSDNSYKSLELMFQGKMMGSLWNKLIRHSLYQDNQINFPTEFNYCEDFYVITKIFMKNITISHLPHAYYHYMFNSTSITRCNNKEIYEQRKIFINQIRKLSINENIVNYIYQPFVASMIASGLYTQNEINNYLGKTRLKLKYISTLPAMRRYVTYLMTNGFWSVGNLAFIIYKKFI